MSFTPGLKVCDNAGMILVGFSMTMNKAMGSSPHQTMATLTMVTSTMVTSALDHGDFDHGDFDHGQVMTTLWTPMIFQVLNYEVRKR